MKIKLDLGHIILLLVIILLIVGSILLIGKYKRTLNQVNSLYEHVSDTLTLTKDELGNQIAKNSVLESNNINLILEIKSQDTNIIWLQKEIEKYKKELEEGSSVTIITDFTHIIDSLSNIIVIGRDTIVKDSLIYLYPIYDFSAEKKGFHSGINDSVTWIKYNVKAGKNLGILDLSIYNDYSVVIGEEKVGFLKPRKTFVEITNYNPYSTISTLKSYRVSQKKTHFTVGIQAGYGITTKGLGPYLGVGVGYTLFKF